jgi:hypothetical protein
MCGQNVTVTAKEAGLFGIVLLTCLLVYEIVHKVINDEKVPYDHNTGVIINF